MSLLLIDFVQIQATVVTTMQSLNVVDVRRCAELTMFSMVKDAILVETK